MKEIVRLQKFLGVKSDLHAQQNPGLLMKHVRELVDVVRCVGTADWDLEVAYKGILQERVQKKAEKPELVVEDGLDMEFI